MLSENYLRHLLQREERQAIQPHNDFSYVNIKLKIMSEVKKLYEHYRDIKLEQFQKQCTVELAEILNNFSEHTLHNDGTRTSMPVSYQVDIHQVPTMLSPIDDPVTVPEFVDFLHTSESFMDFDSDLREEQLRHV